MSDETGIDRIADASADHDRGTMKNGEPDPASMTVVACVPVFRPDPQDLEALLGTLRDSPDIHHVYVIDSSDHDTTQAEALCGRYGSEHRPLPFAFDHGSARNFALDLAVGSGAGILILLTQDCVPTSKDEATKLIRPFGLYPDIDAVTGRQLPRSSASPLERVAREVAEYRATSDGPQTA